MLIPIARAAKLFGSDGGMILTLYSVFPKDFTRDTPLFARIDGLDVPIWCDRFERRGVTGAVVRFADFDTERRAAELLGKELFLDQPEEEEADEFYMEDLIGFRATGFETGADPAPENSDKTHRPAFPQTESSGVNPKSAQHGAADKSAVQSGTLSAKKRSEAAQRLAPDADTDNSVSSPTAGGGSALRRFTGEVTDYFDSETNPLLEITTDEGDEVLVPAAEEFITRIDFEDRLIEFILPEGLMDLNRK